MLPGYQLSRTSQVVIKMVRCTGENLSWWRMKHPDYCPPQCQGVVTLWRCGAAPCWMEDLKSKGFYISSVKDTAADSKPGIRHFGCFCHQSPLQHRMSEVLEQLPSKWKLPEAKWSHVLKRHSAEAQMTWHIIWKHFQGHIMKVDLCMCPHIYM